MIGEREVSVGLDGGDSVRLFDTSGALVDGCTWTAHAAVTYGRCPDGSGAFHNTTARTPGSIDACAAAMDAGVGPEVADSESLGGMKTIVWSDDSHFAGHALRTDTIPCGPLF